MLWSSLIVRSYTLVNRCQTELQKTIGQPAQSPEAFMISKDVASLSSRLETLDKKMDSINLVRIAHDMRSSTDIAIWYVTSTTTRKRRSFKASKINKPRFSQRSSLFSPCCNQSPSTLKTLATMSEVALGTAPAPHNLRRLLSLSLPLCPSVCPHPRWALNRLCQEKASCG